MLNLFFIYKNGANMNYKKRMLKEYSDLNDKIKKLESFLKNKITELDEKQKELMLKQLEVMKSYLEILEERILLEMNEVLV